MKLPSSEISRILLVGQALAVRQALESNEISLGHVIRYWLWSDNAIADLILQVVAGKVIPDAILDTEQGIKGWVFSTAYLTSWLAVSTPVSRAGISVPELAAILLVKQEVAYFLVKNQFIRSGQSDDGKFLVVPYDAIEEFNQTYILLSEIAKRLRSSSRGLLAKLEKLKIYPISGPSVDGGRQIVMRRSSQLELALIQFKFKESF